MLRITLLVGCAIGLPLFAVAAAQAECKPKDECTTGNCRQIVICSNSKEVSLPPSNEAAAAGAPQAPGMPQPGAVATVPQGMPGAVSPVLPRNIASYPMVRSRR